MKVATEIEQMRDIVAFWKKQGFTVGLVPTMGCLHEGHISLIERAVKENDKVIVSDFVNPMQFDSTQDFATYPRDWEKDTQACKEAGASLIFHPDVSEMYQDDFSTAVNVWEGKSEADNVRYRGVCTVAIKLFHIVEPHCAYFEQKDVKKLAVLNKMTRDLNMDIRIIGCPIVRDKTGLAISRQNDQLSVEQRSAATVLKHSLDLACDMLENGEKSVAAIVTAISSVIEAQPLVKLDYVDVLSWIDLKKPDSIAGRTIIDLSIHIGEIHLTDNMIFG